MIRSWKYLTTISKKLKRKLRQNEQVRVSQIEVIIEKCKGREKIDDMLINTKY